MTKVYRRHRREPDVEFEPGWLERQMDDAKFRMMVDHDRQFAKAYGLRPEPFPLGWEDAEKLLGLLSERFKGYTGRSIEDHINTRVNAPVQLNFIGSFLGHAIFVDAKMPEWELGRLKRLLSSP